MALTEQQGNHQAPLPADADDIARQAIADYCRYIDPFMGKSMRLMTDDFVEWDAEGAVVRDVHGRELLDGMTFGGVFGIGHRNPRVVAAVKAQLDRMPVSTRFAFNKPLADLGRMLAQITPGDLRYSFVCSSGTESIEVALKLSRLATERPQIISCMNSFHGMSIGCSSVSGIPYWREGFFPLLDQCKLVPFGDFDAMEKAASNMTAAILVEGVQAGSGCTVPPDGYLQKIRKLCDDRGIIMIVDEIQSGLGRTGKMFSVDHENVTPDIMCLGKCLGGGVMAIGAAVFNDKIEKANLKRPLFNNTTFGGNPLASAAAVATIQTILDENLVENAEKLGQVMGNRLDTLKRKFPAVIAENRGRGMMRSFVVRDARQAIFLMQNMISEQRLILLSPVHTPTMFRVNPPINVDEQFIDMMFARVESAIAAVASKSMADLDANLAVLQERQKAMPDIE